MVWLVILNLGQGSFDEGFPHVTARLGKAGNLWMQFKGSLSAAPEIPQLYRNWRLIYQMLGASRSPIEIASAGVTHVSEVAFSEISEQLKNSINGWLSAEGFRPIELQLRTQLKPSEPVQLIIESDSDEVWRLPWHLWTFFQEVYPLGEVALSTPEYPPPPPPLPQATKARVRILAILGNSTGINLRQDEQSLKKLPHIELKLLVEPQRQELSDRLFEQGWDILFFAGHSSSEENATRGRLYINQNSQNNSLTIEDIREALNRAVYSGLKLAIFNSCDGLGLARDLAATNIPLPPTIVMREPVPDAIAQEFLKYFLKAFAEGEPLHLAVRQAREQLRGLEDYFPGASWLPIICQHPAVVPPTWSELIRPGKSSSSSVKSIHYLPALQKLGLVVLGIVGAYFLIGSRVAPFINWLGRESHHDRQLLRAEILYRLATFLNPNYAAPHYNLGYLYDESLADRTRALAAFQAAMLRKHAPAYAEVARLQIKNRNYDAALSAIWDCLELTQENTSLNRLVRAACLKNRAWIEWEQQQYSEAEADVRQAISLEKNSPYSHYLLAQILD